MTTKFPKSNISVSGEIGIHIKIDGYNFSDTTVIELSQLKQSKSGVYCLRNKFNGRLYIGMAKNLAIRKDRHFNDLMKGIHHSKSLQADFDEINMTFSGNWKDGFNEKFEFEVIIYCYPSQLTFWEGILIDNLHPYYNTKKKKELVTYDEIMKELGEME